MTHLNQLFKQAFQAIATAQNILIVTHFNPDGDGLSSCCAMAEYLQRAGKRYTLFCHSEPPKTYNFLPHIKQFKFVESLEGVVSPLLPISFADYDVILIFDCGSISRTKLASQISQRSEDQIIIEFDHHPKVDDYSNIEIREPQAAATAEVVYHFFRANQIPLTRTMANTLMTGLVTDTANFIYPSTSRDTIQTAADLVRFGAQLPRITDYTLRNKSLDSMKLWGRVMADLQINSRYNFAFTVLPEEEFLANPIDKDELDGIAGFLSSLYGVTGVLFLREEGDGLLRGSLRTSHPKIDISRLARLLGGGGHAKASGFSLKGRLARNDSGWRVE